MLSFRSDRERRLWTWAAASLLAIYATVGLAGRLAGFLRSESLLGITFAAALVLAVAATIGSALRRRSGKREIWVLLAVMAVLASAAVSRARRWDRARSGG